MTNAIATIGLSKRFGRHAAVDGLDLEVPQGSLAGFVGPNGAGKTTTLRMLVGLIKPTGGRGELLGVSLDQPGRYLDRVGALIEGPAFYSGLSGEHNLRVLAEAGGLATTQIPALLERVGLLDRADDLYKTYSLGMKQRLGIAAALLGDPELLILDEPANGLDPEGMHEMRELLRALSAEGKTVLVSSHLLSELEQVCDWLIVINHGECVFQGPPAGLAGDDRLVLRPEHERDLPVLSAMLRSRSLEPHPNGLRVLVPFADADGRTGEIAELARLAASAGIVLVEIAVERTELEQSYLGLVGVAT